MFNALKRLFGAKTNVTVKSAPKNNPADNVIEKRPHNYGLNSIGIFLRSEDYGWSSEKETKKFILVNPKDCENFISVSMLASAWRETGHSEWEYLLAAWFVQDVVNALKENKDTVDITDVFNRDLLASGERVFTSEQIYNHIIKWFEIISENENEVKLAIRINKKAA